MLPHRPLDLICHYSKQLSVLRVQRISIITKPQKTHTDYIELEELNAAISNYKSRLEHAKAQHVKMQIIDIISPST